MSRRKTERLLGLVVCLLSSERYLTAAQIRDAVPGYPASFDAFKRMFERDKEELVAKLHEANIPVSPNTTATFNIDHAYGTADRAIAYVEQLEEVGADEIMCIIQMGTIPQAACMETIRQWGEKVIPHFRAAARAAPRKPR